MTLSQLIAAVERAEGADRELDRAIYYDVLGFCRHDRTERSGYQDDTGFDCLDCGADSWGNLGNKGQRLRDAPPAYTASLDAAMTLVGDNHWRVEDHPMAGPCALVDDHEGYAATPALALCAAALRAHEARAAMEART